MQMIWVKIHKQANRDHLGFIPDFMDASYGKPAAEQIAETYCGGWNKARGLTLCDGASPTDIRSLKLLYPGDPPLEPLWASKLNDEIVVVYEYGYTAIFQPDMTFEVARLD